MFNTARRDNGPPNFSDLESCLHPFLYEVNGDPVKSYLTGLRERFRAPHLNVGKVFKATTKVKAQV
jgi:hypothetical protein